MQKKDMSNSKKQRVNMHGDRIVVDADRSDWGARWGVAPANDKRCWCYSCTMGRSMAKWKERNLDL